MRTVKTAFVALRLGELLTSCKHAYHVGSDGISDEDYDSLEAILIELCPEHPILRITGVPKDDYKNPNISELLKMMGIKYGGS